MAIIEQSKDSNEDCSEVSDIDEDYQNLLSQNNDLKQKQQEIDSTKQETLNQICLVYQ